MTRHNPRHARTFAIVGIWATVAISAGLGIVAGGLFAIIKAALEAGR